MTNLEKLCSTLGITIKAGSMGRVDWEGITADKWRVTLRFEGRSLTTTFHVGIGQNGAEPSAADVIYSLIADARCGEYTIETYCSEFEENPDSRKAHAKWQACKRIAPRVRALLGEHFEALEQAEH